MIHFLKLLIKSYQYIRDHETILMKEYERGKLEAITTFRDTISEYNRRIAELTNEALLLDEKLRRVYEERMNLIDERWNRKCSLCAQQIEQERQQLRHIQRVISQYMNEFTMIFNKLFRHAVFVESAHDSILTSTAQVKASKDMLNTIKYEAQNIINRVEPLLSMTIENDLTTVTQKESKSQSDNNTEKR